LLSKKAAGAVSSQRLRLRRNQSQGARGGPNSGNFLELVSKVLGCAYASYFTDNKGLLTEQALLVSKESLFRQQAFGPSCANALSMPAASLIKLDTTSQS